MNGGDGRTQPGASLSTNAFPVQYRSLDRDSRLNPDGSLMDSSRLGGAEHVFFREFGRTKRSGFTYKDYDKEDQRNPETITVQRHDTSRQVNINVASTSCERLEAPADISQMPVSYVGQPADL